MMGSVCAEKLHKFHHSHQLYHHLTKKALRDIDIPPRKLFGRRPAADPFPDSPDGSADFSKFLPSNTADGDSGSESDDPYSSDHFRMFEFKVRKCSRSRSHDWTDCPFAHPGEKARRRDPRRYNYASTICSDFRKGSCPKGDACGFSHGVFECWLHPSRYRTEACKDGKNCKRKVCFFAHTSRQLRILPEIPSPTDSPTSGGADKGHVNHCCPFCHSMAAASPTSTLMAHVTPPASPPFSPEFSRFRGLDGLNYQEAMAELMATFDTMKVASGSMPWLDVNFGVEQEQPQFLPSPSAPAPIWGPPLPSPEKFSRGGFSGRNLMEASRYNNNESSSGGPNLDWVNDLLT